MRSRPSAPSIARAALIRRAGAVLVLAAAAVAAPVFATPAFAAATDAAVTVTGIHAQFAAGPTGRELEVTFHAVLSGAAAGDTGTVDIADQYFVSCSSGVTNDSLSTSITAGQTDYDVTLPVANQSYTDYTLSATLGAGDGSEAQVTAQTLEGAVISPATFNTGDLDAAITPDDASGASGTIQYQTSNAFDRVDLVQQGGGTTTTPVTLPMCANVFETWQGLAPGQTLEIVDPATDAVLDSYTAPGGTSTSDPGTGSPSAASPAAPDAKGVLAETGVDGPAAFGLGGGLTLVGGLLVVAFRRRRRA